MNPLTQIRNTQNATLSEVARGVSDSGSWHARFKHSAYIYAGGLPYDLTEGDLLAIFSQGVAALRQYGEVVDVNLVRDAETGKGKGFAFLAYEDQRSTVLAVDNLSGAKVLSRTLRVEHVDDYKLKRKEVESEGGVCGSVVPLGASAPGRWPSDRAAGGNAPAARPRVDLPEGATLEDEETHAWGAPPPPPPRAQQSGVAGDDDSALLAAVRARKAAALAAASSAAMPPPPPPPSMMPSRPPGAPDAEREREREAKRAKKDAKKAKKEAKRAGKQGGRRSSSSSSSREGHRRRQRSRSAERRRSRSRSRGRR